MVKEFGARPDEFINIELHHIEQVGSTSYLARELDDRAVIVDTPNDLLLVDVARDVASRVYIPLDLDVLLADDDRVGVETSADSPPSLSRHRRLRYITTKIQIANNERKVTAVIIYNTV